MDNVVTAATTHSTETRERRFACRACDSPNPAVILELGRLPLANAFVADERGTEDHYREDLTLMMCHECGLLQIREEVPREKLFSSYLWVTSTSAAAGAHAVWLSERLGTRYLTDTSRFLVEIASNDGFFLKHYQAAGFTVLGVDPSNLADEASASGLPSLREFFGVEVAERIRHSHGQASVIVARNVLGHVSQLQDLVRGVQLLLAPEGRFVLEVPYAFRLRDQLQYDTVFHEHISYPTVGSVSRLMARHNLKISEVTFVEMNGGSMLCEIVHADSATPRGDQSLVDFETFIDLNSPAGWRSFARSVANQRAALRTLLQSLATEGKRVVGYGAAAKCMTMLNYCGIGPDLLPAIGDANPRKQGMLCPGVRIPVVSPEAIAALDPDFILIGAWNFQEEIIRLFRGMGYRKEFIVPLPVPVIVS